MSYEFVIWDMPDDEAGNIEHVAQHDITQDEAEDVLNNPERVERSRTSGELLAQGYTATGRWIVVIYEEVDPETARIISAYEP